MLIITLLMRHYIFILSHFCQYFTNTSCNYQHITLLARYYRQLLIKYFLNSAILHNAVNTFPPPLFIYCQNKPSVLTLLSAPHSAVLQINPSHSFATPLITNCATLWSQQTQRKRNTNLVKLRSLLPMCLDF